ncbi:DUF4114 domain-containing protein [Sphingomonas sp. ID1715]|nr:DUF4114 domain-containing protein [Sphingomonas sp. ID1715]
MTWRFTTAAAATLMAPTPAISAFPSYPTPGTENPLVYDLRASANGDLIAYFAGSTASFTNVLGLLVNGVDTGITGLNNQSTAPGTALNFGPVSAGDRLTFYIDVAEIGARFYSDPSLNEDGINHVYSAPYEGGDFDIPAGLYVAFEDLPGGGDFNYEDLQFVFSNAFVASVPEPEQWALLIAGFALTGAAARRRARVAVTFA